MEKGVEYKAIDKFTFEDFKKTIPKDLIPTKKMTYALLGILVIVLIYNFFNFPVSQFFSMDSLDKELLFEIGWPQPFFVLDLMNPEKLPIRFGGILLDFAIYILLAYLIDVTLNAFLNSGIIRNLIDKQAIKDAKPKLVNINIKK